MAPIHSSQVNQDEEKFKELLMFYVNGTLEREEHAFVENYLQMHPEMNAYVTLNQKIMQAVQGEDEAFEYDGTTARHRLLARIRADESLKHEKHGFFKRLFGRDWAEQWVGNFQRWGFSPALGIVCLLMVGQSLLLLNVQNEASKYRGIVNTVNIAPHFQLTVSPKADFYDLADLLRKNGCNVVSGPSQNGELWIKLDEPAKSKQIKSDLLKSGLVDEVITLSPEVQ